LPIKPHPAFLLMYSLSTCWNSHRHTDGRALLQEVRDLGFEFAELGHGTRISLLPGIIEAVESGLIRISSLHNFCPLPMGVTRAAPNIFRFSSDDPRERDNAFRHTVKTLDFAAQLGARLVVLHMGSIDMKDPTDRLVAMLNKGEKEDPHYERLCLEFIEKREVKKERPLAQAYEVLHRLVPEAESRGLKLGIENRDGVTEIPLESDLLFFFREFTNPLVCYWHDTGHAQVKENLGFIQHVMHLETYAERLGGFHVHDVEFPDHDHRPPGQGMVNFAGLKPWVKPEHLKVFEFSPTLTTEEVSAGVAHLKGIWGSE
jgi:sugar phosphate isomerase/epimerase